MFNLEERIMEKKLIITLSLFIFILTSGVQLHAQVTIGGDPSQPPQPPKSFSILELISVPTINVGGLRLPQLNEQDKLDINSALTNVANKEATKGLFIYNTEKSCIEYWDSDKWVDPITADKLPWQLSPGTPVSRSADVVTDSIYHTGVVSVGTKSTDPTAVLFVQSDSMGVVVPRMTEAQRDKIKKPANGLVIFNTDEECFNYYSLPDTTWQSVCGKLGKAIIDSAYCSQIRVYGSYIKGVETTVNERLVIPVEVTKIGSYDITVVAMYNSTTDNGYTFTASGTFLYEGKQTITLTAQGTPKNEDYDPANPAVGDHLQINFNGTMLDPGCSNVVIPVVPATADYTVSCGSAVVYGVYTMAPDNTNSDDATHYIEVQVNVNDISGGATSGWSAETNKVSGVQFRGSGKFTDATPNQKIQLYAVAGTKPTTLDPIVLTMTFQTKNGAVDCQVTLRAAYTSKKIVIFGSISYEWGYALDSIIPAPSSTEPPGSHSGAAYKFLESPYNFGSLNTSTVKMVDSFSGTRPTVPPNSSTYYKMGAFLVRWARTAANTSSNWDLILSEKPDIIIITYNTDPITDATTLTKVLQYLNAGGIILHFTETTPAAILNKVFGTQGISATNPPGAAGSTRNEYVTLPNFQDPVLNGPFQPEGLKTLGGLNIAGDTEYRLWYATGVPASGVLVYGYNVSTGGQAAGGISVFRATGQRYFYFGDGGYFCNNNNNKWDLTYPAEPFATTHDFDSSDLTYRPAARPANPGYTDQVYNSFFFGNLMAWAINEAQFYGINSGN